MCGRFNAKKKLDEIRQFYGVKIPDFEWQPNPNVAPTEAAPVLLQGKEPELRLMKFGYDIVLNGKPLFLFNRQSEKAAEKNGLKLRRCIIPAVGFYEWEKVGKAKQPWFFSHMNEPFLSLAGIWREIKNGEAFIILTTTANDLIKPLHARITERDVPSVNGNLRAKT
jgi:putative SOS response-associated peptidase YedK